MPTTAPDPAPSSLPPGPAPDAGRRRGRRPFRDNPRLILLGILVLLAALVAMVTLADRSAELNPNFLTEVVLYALSIADLTMLVALGFVLARNVVKLMVERRRGLPFSRFRAKLVGALLGLTIVPALLVLLVGSELIRSSTQKWMSQPVDAVLGSAKQIAGEYYREREAAVVESAARVAGALPVAAVRGGDTAAVRRAIDAEVTQGRMRRIDVYAVGTGAPIASAHAPGAPDGAAREGTDLFARRVAGGAAAILHEAAEGGGEVVQAGAVVADPATGQPLAVVVASDYLTGELAVESRRIIDAYEDYSRLRVLSRPLQGIYLSLFVMMTLMILVSATWLGLYLAKRITRPVHMLAEGAREIGAGHFDHRIQAETRDEFGSLIEAFNAMAGELAASQRKLERSAVDLERKNLELDERRRYIETVLERIATGVVSMDARGAIETINGAALRLLDVGRAVAGMHVDVIFAREDLAPLRALVERAHPGLPRRVAAGAEAASDAPRRAAAGAEAAGQEVTLVRDGRELHLAAAATPLLREDGSPEGAVLVFDDVTPLIRTQRVAAWRDVARRLAHEIKNPLTPIQLSAERMRRHFASAPPRARDLVEECTATIVGEVESLKGLVDEFAQFARMPAPRTVPSDLNATLGDALALYDGLFSDIRIERRFDPALPPVRMDVEQIRRVVINLVDNAVEALDPGGARAQGRSLPSAAARHAAAPKAPGGLRLHADEGPVPAPTIVVETERDGSVARIVVADNGPGIPAADRDKLFMPYYSTRQRGSGLGLAIVRRVVVEHGGSIEVHDNAPHGTRFVVELPL